MPPTDVYLRVFNDPMFMENGMVISMGRGRPCWIVDPGLPPQAKQMITHITSTELTPEAIVLTHAHGDHIAGIDELRARFVDLPVYLAGDEWPLLSDPRENLSAGHGADVTADVADPKDLAPGATLSLDGTTWTIFDTAGHSPASRTLYSEALKLALVGDAVFAGSVGRVDFHHSDGPTLLRNIRANILTLPDDTTLMPGHGPATTVGQERKSNPYLQADDSWASS